MAYCGSCGAPGAGAFCSQCGKPSTAAPLVPDVARARSAAGPLKRKVSPVVLTLAAIGGLLFFSMLLIVAIALPRLSRARMSAQETAAIMAIQTINTAQAQYYSQFGRYAIVLTELGPPASGKATAASDDLIDATLGAGLKQGYQFTLSGSQGGYTLVATPETFGTSGSRTFYSDQTMVIHQNYGPEPATAASPEIR
jgi:type IV pilus assembly protein PilA